MSEIQEPTPTSASGPRLKRDLWMSICESVTGRRRKATEGLAIVAAAGMEHRVPREDREAFLGLEP